MGFRKTGDATHLGRVDINQDTKTSTPDLKLSEAELKRLAEHFNENAEPSQKLREAVSRTKAKNS